jgi:hypothetical protein
MNTPHSIPPPSPPEGARSPRYAVLDFARLAAVFMMIQGHAMGTFVMQAQIPSEGFGGAVYTWVRGLTSPTFLLISGIVNFVGIKRDEQGRVLSRILRKRVRRAVTLILVDYLLIFPCNRVWDLFSVQPEQWFSFFRVGTLNIIGVSLLLVTGLMAVTRTNRSFLAWSVAIGASITIATPYVHQVDWFTILPAYFAHYLSFKGGGSFSIFPHTAYLFVGAGLGGYALRLLRDPQPWKFAFRFGEVGLALVIVTLAGWFVGNRWLPPHEYWVSSPFMVSEKIGLAMLMISLYAVVFHFTEGAAAFYSRLSRKNIVIYVAHILVIFGNTWVWSFSRLWHNNLTIWQGIPATLLVLALSYGIGIAIVQMEQHRPKVYTVVRYLFASILAAFLLIGI